LAAVEHISDKYVAEAAPEERVDSKRQRVPLKKWLIRAIPAAACVSVFLLATTAFAASYIQNSLGALASRFLRDNIGEFYWRYISPEDMTVADSIAERYGVQVYFDSLKTGDIYQQYFSINKLVGYYNDEKIRAEAIEAITPFLNDSEEKLSDAAAFALSILSGAFDDPRIFHMADETVVFTLFNEYSKYGTYNQLYFIRNGELASTLPSGGPYMYLGRIIQSPDAKRLAVTFNTRQSGYLIIFDFVDVIGGLPYPELVDSARIMAARELDIPCWQRTDYENYSAAYDIEWADDYTLAFNVGMTYTGMEFVEATAFVTYNCRQMLMEVTDIELLQAISE